MLALFAKVTVEGEVGGFVGVFVEVIHEPRLAFENGIFPTVLCDHTAPRAFAVGGEATEITWVDNLQVGRVDLGNGTVAAKVTRVIGTLEGIGCIYATQTERGGTYVYVIDVVGCGGVGLGESLAVTVGNEKGNADGFFPRRAFEYATL